jgi:hypothetical protein
MDFSGLAGSVGPAKRTAQRDYQAGGLFAQPASVYQTWVPPTVWDSSERAMNSSMDKVASSPGQAYDYINSNYGLPGLIVAGVLLVVFIVGIMIALDRRK